MLYGNVLTQFLQLPYEAGALSIPVLYGGETEAQSAEVFRGC